MGQSGKKRIIIHVQQDGPKASSTNRRVNAVGLRSIGLVLSDFGIARQLLDMDGDGQLEWVFAGDETGIAYYRELQR